MTATPPPPSLPNYVQYQELLSTLPKERGWVFSDIYEYEGFWLPPDHLRGLVSCQNHFRAQDGDIILVTNPKSGTTWLKAMAYTLLTRSQFLDDQNHPLLTTNPNDLVPFLESELYHGRELPDLSTLTSPRVFATHAAVGSLPRSVKTSSCKVVYLCRNPKDVFVSFWYFSNSLRPIEWCSNNLKEDFDRFCSGVSEFGPFWDHVLGYWNESLKNPHKVLFLKYEELLEQPTVQLKRLAEFLGCPFSSEEESKCRFVDEGDNLSDLKMDGTCKVLRSYLQKGKDVGGWRNVLTPEMIKRIDHITEQKMHEFGFKF